jgi:hypothetical protein
MAKKEPKGDYPVGYGRPPKAGQIKPGEVRNPWGCRGKSVSGKLDIAPTLEKQVVVRVGNRTKKMSVFEAGVRSLVNEAIRDKKVASAIKFFELCEKHDLIAQPTPGGVISLTIPKDYDPHKWLEMLHAYGPPPWPGEHNGLPKSGRLISAEPARPDFLPNPLQKRPRAHKRNHREIVLEIAAQKHWVTEAGKRRRCSILDMVLIVLGSKAAEAHPRAQRFHDGLCAKFGVQAITRIGLVVPEQLTEEEWEAMFPYEKPDSSA